MIAASVPKHLTVFQRPPSYSMPSLTSPFDRSGARAKAWFDNRDALHRQQRDPIRSSALVMTRAALEERCGAFDVDEEERKRRYEKSWQQGGLGIVGTFKDLMTDKQANDTAVRIRP